MPFSQTLIVNMALSNLGQSIQVASISENTTAARTALLWWDPAREHVLRAFDWPFARRLFVLDLVEEEPDDRWAYSYRWPTDCLALRRVIHGSRDLNDRVAFEIGGDGSGRLIFSDDDEPTAVYTSDHGDPLHWPADFADALAWRLAHHIAIPVAQSDAMRARAQAEAERAINRAAAAGFNEEDLGPRPDTDLLRSRR